ncbi:transposase [Streptomyces xanthophaeus]|uniref:transposase n=1 Tax=Streptomyces xanthophaeus TaxID=67385 RepID=UPI0038670552
MPVGTDGGIHRHQPLDVAYLLHSRRGVAWRDAPDRYGSGVSLHTRFRRWEADGTFERMLQARHDRHEVASTTIPAPPHRRSRPECAHRPGPIPGSSA